MTRRSRATLYRVAGSHRDSWQAEDRALLDRWMAKWDDLVDFEVHPVLTGDGPGVEARRQRRHYALMAREETEACPFRRALMREGSAFEKMRAVSDSAAGTKGSGDVDRFG